MGVKVDVVIPADYTGSVDNLVLLAGDLINAAYTKIMSWVQGSRRSISNASRGYSNLIREFPAITAQHTYNNGVEQLTLKVFPSKAFGEITRALGFTFVIIAPFSGWPLLAFQNGYSGYLETIYPMYGYYFFVPQFVPNIPTAPNINQPNSYNGSSYWYDWSQSFFDLKWTYYDTGSPPPFYEMTLYSEDPFDSANFGFTPFWWTTNVGGSGICASALNGTQYWEVEIIALPTAVPANRDLPLGNVQDGTYTDLGYQYNDPTVQSWRWPADLNTFFNPAIGVVPATFRDPLKSGNYQAFGGVIGIENDATPVARSLGLQRMKSVIYNQTQHGWQSDLYTVTDQNGSVRYFSSFDGGNPNVSPPSTVTAGNAVGYFAVGGIAVIAALGPSGATGPYPTAADVPAPAPSGSTYFYIGNIQYQLVGYVGASVTDGSLINTTTYTPGYWFTNTTPTNLGDIMQPLLDFYDNNGNPNYSGPNAPGEHFIPVLGRWDCIYSLLQPSQTIAIDNGVSSGFLTNGCWSGHDLGAVAVGDTYMVATNTNTREVWFGKNGKWYDKTGPTTLLPGQLGLPGALLMDGDSTVKYYPACSYRLGLTHLRMKFGVAQKYKAPAGFSSYSSIPTITTKTGG